MILVFIVNFHVSPSYFYEINNYTCTVKVVEYHQLIFMILVIILSCSVSWTYLNDDPVLLPPQLATLPAWSVWALPVTTVSPVLSPVRSFSRGSVWMTADPSTMSKRTGAQVCLFLWVYRWEEHNILNRFDCTLVHVLKNKNHIDIGMCILKTFYISWIQSHDESNSSISMIILPWL